MGIIFQSRYDYSSLALYLAKILQDHVLAKINNGLIRTTTYW